MDDLPLGMSSKPMTETSSGRYAQSTIMSGSQGTKGKGIAEAKQRGRCRRLREHTLRHGVTDPLIAPPGCTSGMWSRDT